MARTKARISRKSVAALQRGEWLTDDVIPGFKARRPNRLALYGLNIRLNGRMRWISLGSEAELTPDQARAEAERYRGLKRQGVDPATLRDRQKAGLLLEAVAERFVKDHVALKLRSRTAYDYRALLKRLILPEFGRWKIESITEADVSRWHGSLSDTPAQANRVLAILSSLMTWSVRRKYRLSNPCRDVVRFRERTINRYPNGNDLAQILRAIDELSEEGALSPLFAAALKVLMMTGARRSEIFHARWEWLDVERLCLVLPESKTGEKAIALPQAALDVILALPRLSQEWIFPSLKTNRPTIHFTKPWRAVLARANVGHWRMHDLRHGFASAAVTSGAPLYVVGRQLGHVRPNTTARYSHVFDAPKREVVETVAGLIGKRPTQ